MQELRQIAMAENTRNKGRVSAILAASTTVTLPEATRAVPAPEPTTTTTQTALGVASHSTQATLDLILANMETMKREVNGSFVTMNSKMETSLRDTTDRLTKLTELIERDRVVQIADRRELQIAKQEVLTLREQNRRIEVQLNQIINRQNICNLRIDGKREEDGENLKDFVIKLAHGMGVRDLTPMDIITVYRMGKQAHSRGKARSRTVMVTMINERARNALFYARTSLKNSEQFKGIYINDDVTSTTRKQRDDYRAVAALARQNGAEVRVHTDGIIISGRKYLLSEPQSLPQQFSVSRAKTYENNGEIYFASEGSFLSNFSPSPIVEGDITYRTAEHMYQALRCRHATDNDKFKAVLAAPTPLEAKRIADGIGETPEWRQARDAAMERVVSEKFDQNPNLAKLLLETGDMPLNEATHNEHFGIGATLLSREIRDKSYKGTNRLGHILVAKRASIKDVDS